MKEGWGQWKLTYPALGHHSFRKYSTIMYQKGLRIFRKLVVLLLVVLVACSLEQVRVVKCWLRMGIQTLSSSEMLHSLSLKPAMLQAGPSKREAGAHQMDGDLGTHSTVLGAELSSHPAATIPTIWSLGGRRCTPGPSWSCWPSPVSSPPCPWSPSWPRRTKVLPDLSLYQCHL